MSTEQKCPECGTKVSPKGNTIISGIEGAGGRINYGPLKEPAICPNPDCETRLIRNVEPPGDAWQAA